MTVDYPQAFVPYRVDLLFLLIGSNPLPNYVAARILAQEQGTIVLLHSTATSAVAERLVRRLRSDRPGLTFQLYGVPQADGPAIARKVSEVARSFEQSYPRVSVGLNYTGGTKPMAAYSYRALAQLFPAGVFSYLDARTLSMVIDPGGRTVQQVPVGRSIRLKLDDIANLHGYEIKQRLREPHHSLFANAIAEVHLAPGGLDQWRKWLDTWRDGATLSDLAKFPTLEPALKVFAEACGGSATESGVAQALGFQGLKQCGKYFAGGWLEDYTLDALSSIASEAGLDDFAAGAIVQAAGRPNFEFDVIATLGYQLFGLSCVVTEQKPRAKEHLMEVFTRAGQLGGDEARFAAVTFCDDRNVKDLEREVSEAWDATGKIKVFGRSHVQDSSTHLLKWFREANQEVS